MRPCHPWLLRRVTSVLFLVIRAADQMPLMLSAIC